MNHRRSRVSRRQFLSRSLGYVTTAGAFATLPRWNPEDDKYRPGPGRSRTPLMRTLGRTGLTVPVIGAGCGAGNDDAFIAACYDTGIRLFDTDARYRGGRHEEMLGRTFDRLGVRQEVIIVTKLHPPEHRRGRTPAQALEQIQRECDKSLRRLRTDYIDVLMIQDVSTPGAIHDQATREALARLKQAGKARFAGIATHERMATAVEAATEAGDYDVILTSVNFTMADDNRLLSAITRAAKQGIGIMAMKSQAGGSRFPNPATLRDYPGTVVNSAALKWVLHNKDIAAVVPGMDNFDHLRANFGATYSSGYTEQEEQFLANNRIRLGMEFCRGCGQCLASCPYGVDIPSLMRTHMYARQYGDFERARQTRDTLPRGHGLDACTECGTCSASCVRSVQLARRIAELKLLHT